MRLATLCSGIGAPEVAAKRLGWECLWSAEIEPFPSAVLAHHHPESVNLGDITKIDGRELERPDVLVFGTPCQSFSVAGKRAGMDDPRGVLAFVALGIVGRVRPSWFILENVPGLLSSSQGRDFGAFLRAVDECGYSGAWASPDAQFFGVPQRRERVFFIGHSGDWRYPAAVLSQFSRLCGHPAPSREKGERVADSLTVGANQCSGRPGDFVEDVAHSLRAEGFDASEDGTGRGTPLVPQYLGNAEGGAREIPFLTVSGIEGVSNQTPLIGGSFDALAFSCKDSGGDVGEVSPPLRAMGHDGSHANAGGQVAICFEPRSPDGHARVVGDISPTLNRMGGGQREPCVAFTQNQAGDVLHGDVCPAMGTNQNATGRNTPKVAVAFMGGQGSRARSLAIGDKSPPIKSTPSGGNTVPTLCQGMSVRRLTPLECERLQGFPDEYTLIPYGKKGKPATDGPRYKALGNSMAVPVVEWLLRKILSMEANQ